MENLDAVYDAAIDKEDARVAVTEMVTDPFESPGTAWRLSNQDRSRIEGILRSESLVIQATLDLIREDVAQAREEGVSWTDIGKVLEMPAELIALAFGGEVVEP